MEHLWMPDLSIAERLLCSVMAMREHGLVDIAHVRYAVLEPDGKISILTRRDPSLNPVEVPQP